MRLFPPLLLALFLATSFVGCPESRQEVSTTRGSATVECDESIYPVMKVLGEDFENQYPESKIHIRSLECREAIANFINDSVRVIVSARPFNKEERDVIATLKIEVKEFKVALDAIAVIVRKENPVTKLRTTELDSIFTGTMTRWPGKNGGIIDVVIGGVNSSTNEVFRNTILGGKPFALSATPTSASGELVNYVTKTKNAIGIVGISWLKGGINDLSVVAVANPFERPDTTQPPGHYYSPAQANIYRKYYPLSRDVYMYTREWKRDVGYGFIAYVSSVAGQKIFLNNGLVPATMPVRLVELTSYQVK
jgi:phosphate transport system substrate-binding protein